MLSGLHHQPFLRVIMFVISLMFGITSAHAKENLVLLPMQSEGLSSSDKNLFQAALKQGLSAKYKIFSGDQVEQKLKKFSVSSCTSSECLEKIAIAFNGSLVGRGSVTPDKAGYLLTFMIKDVYTDQDIVSLSEVCSKCSKGGVVNMLKQMVRGGKSGTGVQWAGQAVDSGPSAGGVTRITPKVSGDTTSTVAALFFESDPAGAEVYLGDTYSGQTPFQNFSLLAGQQIRITLKKTDYHDKVIQVTLSGGTNDLGNIKLKSTFGSLSVTSEPSGADVYLAGKKVGQTPYSGNRIRSRAYLLSVKKDLYLPVENQRVVIKDEKKSEKHFVLKPNFGVLNVGSTPDGAEVLIMSSDNRQVASGTTPAELRLMPGEYRAVIKKSGYTSLTYNVKIAWNSRQRITKEKCMLRRLEGSAIISSDPFQRGALVYIGGVQKGEVPLTIKLPVGEYEVEIRTKEKRGKQKIVIKDGKTVTAQIKLAKAQQNQLKNSLGMKFVYIKPGSFMMGSPTGEPERDDDEKQYRVTLTKGFYMQTTEVTQGQWKAVMGNNPSKFKNCGDDCPVEKVSWEDVQKFIRKLNQKAGKQYRLPTEAEWEYAARAGSATRFSFGDSDSRLGDYTWYSDNSGGKTHKVAQKKSNAWGLYDIHGNVWEWCQDWYGDYLSGNVTDPEGPSSGSNRVLRGGSWGNFAWSCRCANRDWSLPGRRHDHGGFRLVLLPGQQ